jgi:ABC transport system ATP-binding/permease protein
MSRRWICCRTLLADYSGTVLLVSHDRDFIDRVATMTLILQGEGRITAYAGGWTDALAQGGELTAPGASPAPPPTPAKLAVAAQKDTAPASLSFTERHRLAELPARIARLEAEIAKLSDLLTDPDLYLREPVKAKKATEMLADRQAALSAAEEEWLALEAKAEAASG